MKITDYKVLTFDCYGTLIDWESGIWDALQPLLMRNRCQSVSRQQGLTLFSDFETRQELETPGMLYPDLLSAVHAMIAEDLNLQTDNELNKSFGHSVPHWPAFPDTADALRALQQHFKLVILSNVHKAGFAASNRKLGVEFDAVYTAEEIGSYKPNPDNFEFMLKRLKQDLNLQSADVLHTAQSLHHDHVQAAEFNLANAWIDRQQLSRGGEWGATAMVENRPKTDFIFFSMQEMVAAI